jgi:hypothetical protein
MNVEDYAFKKTKINSNLYEVGSFKHTFVCMNGIIFYRVSELSH